MTEDFAFLPLLALPSLELALGRLQGKLWSCCFKSVALSCRSGSLFPSWKALPAVKGIFLLSCLVGLPSSGQTWPTMDFFNTEQHPEDTDCSFLCLESGSIKHMKWTVCLYMGKSWGQAFFRRSFAKVIVNNIYWMIKARDTFHWRKTWLQPYSWFLWNKFPLFQARMLEIGLHRTGVF